MTEINMDKLPQWRVEDHRHNDAGFVLVDAETGRGLVYGLAEPQAVLMAAAPSMLKFMDDVSRRIGSPCQFPVETILRQLARNCWSVPRNWEHVTMSQYW